MISGKRVKRKKKVIKELPSLAYLDSSISFKGLISDSSLYQTEVSECSGHSSHYWLVKLLGIKDLEVLLRGIRTTTQRAEKYEEDKNKIWKYEIA